VAYVDHIARLSGGELALLRTLPAVLDHVDPIVILGEDGPLRSRLEKLGVDVRVLALNSDIRDTPRGNVLSRAIRPHSALALARYVLALRSCLRSERVQLVHTNSLKSAVYGGLAGRLAGLPVLWHVRDRLTGDYLTPGTAAVVALTARLLPTAVIANSRASLATVPKQVTSSLLFNPLVPDGVAQNPLPPIRGDGIFRIGMVGRLAQWKGQDVFLRAFAEAFAGQPVHACLLGSAMFGEDAYAAELSALAEQLGVADQVHFLGFREDVWAELATFDLLVHASTTPEPFGQVILEGMAAGLAVVASAEGGPTEIITAEVDGLLIPPRDPTLLATALLRLHADPALRERLGAAGRVTAARYSPAATATALLAVYDSLVPAARAG
jgi:glycosyltransferase involved in cell wall biosynthesis